MLGAKKKSYSLDEQLVTDSGAFQQHPHGEDRRMSSAVGVQVPTDLVYSGRQQQQQVKRKEM